MSVDNIQIATQLKKLQEEMNSLVEAQTRQLRSQADAAREVVQTYQQFDPSDQVRKIEQIKESLDKASQSLGRGEIASAFDKINKGVKQAADYQQKFGAASQKTKKTLLGFAAVTGIFSGFIQGLGSSVNLMKLFGSGALSALESLGQFALAVITFPFKILSNLIDFASKGGGDSGLRQAIEDIRKEFGHLNKASAKAIFDMSRNMQGQLANTGLSTRRIFGFLVDKLKALTEYAKTAGPLFAVLAGQFAQNAEAVGAYYKGLGLTEEGQKGVATRAFALGQELTEVTRQLANYSLQMADSFGLSAKQISRDVGDMMNDFENFGGMAPKVLSQISVYARRLGVEVKGLLGIISQFDNFEDAARSAAQLTQAFGIQVDALEMLKAQDPAQRTEMMRKAFFAAGRSIETMTRQERALLQQQTGLEANTLDLVFAAKNQGLSYDQVKKKSDSAQKSQLTQAEALKSLAGAIERMVKSGALGSGGFFERFIQGFERGIVRSRDFRKLMWDIRRALRATYWAGAEVGRMFVKFFPGIQNLVKGLQGFFAPERFRKLLGGIKDAFRTFFTDLTGTKAPGSTLAFMESLKKTFLNYFDSNSESGRKILTGLKTFLKAFGVIAGSLLREALKGITGGINILSDFIAGARTMSIPTDGIMGFVMEILAPIGEALEASWPALKDAFVRLFDLVWPKVRDFLIANAGTIALILFGPAVTRGLVSGLVVPITGAFVTGITQGLLGAVKNALVKKTAQTVAQSVVGDVGSAFNKQTGSMTEGVKKAIQLGDATKGFGLREAVALGLKLIAIAGALAMGGVMLAGSIWLIVNIIKGLPEEKVHMAFGVLAAGVLGMLGLSGALKLLQGVNWGVLAKAATGFLAMGVISIAMAGNFVLLAAIMSSVTMEDAQKIAIGMGAMSLVYLAGAGLFMVAAGIGATIIGTKGIAALAAVAGLATIALVVQGVAEHAMSLIRQINALRVGPGLEGKTKAFVMVVEAITGFADTFATVIEAGGPSVVDLIGNPFWRGSPRERIKETFGQIIDIIQTLGGTIRGIITMIMRYLPNIGRDEAQLKGAAAVSSLLEAVTGLAKALQPPPEATSGIFGTLFPTLMMVAFLQYMRNMGPVLEDLFPVVLQLMENVSKIPLSAVSMEQIKAFSSLLEGIGSLLSSLAPSGSMGGVIAGMAALDETNRQMNGIPGVQTVFGEQNTNNMVGFMQNMITFAVEMLRAVLGSGMFDQLGRLITGMSGALFILNPEQIKGISAMGEMIGSLMEAVSSIAGSIQMDPETIKALGRLNGGTRRQLFSFMKTAASNIIVPLVTFAPVLIGSLLELVKNIPSRNLDNVSKTIQSLSAAFGVLAEFPGLINSFTKKGGGGEDAESFSWTSFHRRLAAMDEMVKRIFVENGPLTSIMQAIGNPRIFPAVRGNPAEKFEQLQKSLSSIQSISQFDFEGLVSDMDKLESMIRDETLVRVGTNIKAMVQQVNMVATDLGSIQPVNINTQLKALAGRLGLGQSDEITIKNRNFNIDVKLDVHIDAKELEHVLLDRPNSRIQKGSGRSGQP